MLPDLPLIARVHSGEVEGGAKTAHPTAENKNSTVVEFTTRIAAIHSTT
jgi:hypothetical protein